MNIQELRSKRMALVQYKKELEQTIQKTGIKSYSGRSDVHRHTEKEIRTRDKAALELLDIDKEIGKLNIEINNFSDKETIFRNLVKEILTNDQWNKLIAEAVNRENGGVPTKLNITAYDTSQTENALSLCKKNGRSLIDIIVNIRKAITLINDDGMAKYGKADFLKLISPLNTIVPPVRELEKMQREKF